MSLIKRASITIASAAAALILFAAPALAQKAPEKTPPPPKIKVGDMAPNFKLLDQNGKAVSLQDFRGKKNVALAFYVFAFTGG